MVKLEVGKNYKAQDGKIVTIERNDGTYSYQFRSWDTEHIIERAYDENGVRIGQVRIEKLIEEVTESTSRFKVGDEVKVKKPSWEACQIDDYEGKSCPGGQIIKILHIREAFGYTWVRNDGNWVREDTIETTTTSDNTCDNKTNNEVKIKMDMTKIKKENLKAAQKQFNEETMNEEIEYAKKELRRANDNINRIDRAIKVLEDEKIPYQEIIGRFK